MAPSPMSQSRFKDDFIPTISDDEADIPYFDEEDEDSAPSSLHPDDQNVSKKRKRDVSEAHKSKKKPRKDGQAATHPGSLDLEDVDLDTAADLDDGAFDPEFEFDVGGGKGGVVGRDVEWDFSGRHGGSVAKGMSIEEIIARRRGTQEEAEVENGSREEEEEIEEEEEEEEEEDEAPEEDGEGEFAINRPIGLDGTETGVEGNAGVSTKQHESMVAGEKNGSHGEMEALVLNDKDAGGPHGGDDDDDDDDSVAEPVAHPDDEDLPRGGSDDEEEKENPEVLKRRAAYFAHEEEPVEKRSNTTTASFQSMSLSRPILKGLATLNFKSPTPIQVKTIPMALLGKDIVGGAVTGSGKTAAFIIPLLERLLYRSKVPKTRVAILMPTRELAVQCYNVATKLASFIPDLSFALLVGGLSLREQEQALKKRPDIVIATPGRFIDHMRNSVAFQVESLEILVLDEADRMLEDGFADELNEILTSIPKSRQTMLFSATMTEDVDQLIRVGMNRPVRVMVDAKKQTVEGLVQEFIKMKGAKGEPGEERRLAYLLHLCMNVYTAKTIVFLPRKVLAHRVKVLFSLHGVKAAELHGGMSQEQRLGAIAAFTKGDATHLLATDLASRGLDIPHVETVLNFTVPTTQTTYLHRVGRTARAGQSGVSCTLFSGAKTGSAKSESGSKTSDRTLLRPILRLARNQKAKIRTRTLPPSTINELTEKITSLDDEIQAILQEEKEERLIQQTERDVTKGENLVRYEDEIASRPRRTWFQSEKEKESASKLGAAERRGVEVPAVKKEKRKLSGKQKKRLEDRDERAGGRTQGWKKGKAERSGKGVLQKEKELKIAKRRKAGAGEPKANGEVTRRPKGKPPTKR